MTSVVDIDEHPDVAPLPTMTVCLVPRVTSLCMKFLENLGIRDLVKLRQCDINFIPIEPDVLTLEYESAFLRNWCVKDITCPRITSHLLCTNFSATSLV